MGNAKETAPRFHVGEWVSFDFGPRRIEARVIEDRGPIGVRGRRVYRVTPPSEHVNPNGSPEEESAFEMPENVLQPADPPVRQAFYVTYVRQGSTNNWIAVTKLRELLTGVKAKGAVAYSAASWQEQPDDNVRGAHVLVLLEVDRRLGDPNAADSANPPPRLIREARERADELFLSEHPRARIEHRDP